MTAFIKKLNKYIILLIIHSLVGMPWIYLRHIVFEYNGPDTVIESIPTMVEYLVKLAVIFLLIIDFKREKLNNLVLTCIAAFFFPLLGIVIFAVMLIDKEARFTHKNV